MEIKLRLLHIDDNVKSIITELSRLQMWIIEEKKTIPELRTNKEWSNQFGDIRSYYSGVLTWNQVLNEDNIEYELRVDAVENHLLAEEYLGSGNEEIKYDGFILDVYGEDSTVKRLDENARSIANYITDTHRDVRIFTAYEIKLEQYMRNSNSDGDSNSDNVSDIDSGVPHAWGWPKSENILLSDILILKNTKGKDHELSNWMYQRTINQRKK